MADVKKETDGPRPDSSSGFDFTLLPDYDNDFIEGEDIQEFARALAAPENSPSTEDLLSTQAETRTFITALNDWRPVHQRVRPKKKSKKPPRRGKDETREGVVYQLLKWPLLIFVLGWLLVLGISYTLTRLYIYLYEHWITWRGRRQRLRKQLQNSVTYEDWVKASKELDTYLGNDAWKKVDDYAYYDSKTIRRVRGQLVKLRNKIEGGSRQENGFSKVDQQKAAEELRGLLEACVKNNFVGFENPRLYSETYYGTKDLVQSFVDEAAASLSCLLNSNLLDQESKRSLFKQLNANFGRTALCLSGGATFAYYHFGVAKALLDAGLLPEVITGTSGGALVAGLLCTRTDEELKKLLVPALAHRITACHDDMFTWIKRWYQTGARFDSIDWAWRCSWFTRGSMTFREAYDRTGRILNVSCVPSDPHSPTILANYITSPDCVIWSAVLASAAVPGILNPVVLMKKTKDGTLQPYSFGHKWKDGSLRTDIPLKALNLHFNVRFSIVSQVNPHINLFFFSSRGAVGRPVTHRRGRGWRGGFLGSAIEQYIKLDLTKWLKVLRHLELLPRPLGQDWSEIWLQRFSGTITIWPKSVPSDFYYILSDPTPDRLARMIRIGQQSAFPKLTFIANRAKLERLIRQGCKLAHPSGATRSGLGTVLSDEDLHRFLKRAKEDAPFSGSESSDEASRPGTPADESFGFSFARKPSKSSRAAPESPSIESTEEVPPSPSLSQRLTGWWKSSTTGPLDDPKTRPKLRQRNSSPSASPLRHQRPSSMFELRTSHRRDDTPRYLNEQYGPRHRRKGSVFEELANQTRIFVDDTDDEEDSPAEHQGGTADVDTQGGAEELSAVYGDDDGKPAVT